MKGLNFYKKINIIIGWIVFSIALISYTATMEKSGSFWDCGEFIPVASKLQIAHPPGAPFFSIVGRVLSVFAEPDSPQAAIMINFLSALSTAFVSLFCFWIITSIARKIMMKGDEDYSMPNILAIMGAGIVGALSVTYADSVWFSAVEGEVYALSFFFMTFVAWASIKWEEDNSPDADKWMVLIAFMIGLSTGVHLLSLLALPFVGCIIFYKKFKFSWIGLIASVGISFGMVVFVMEGVIVGIPRILTQFELLFVNGMGMGFNTGVWIGIVFIVTSLIGVLYYSHVKNKYYLNLVILSFIVLLIGYSSYMIVPIRAVANPPINMNRPTDVFSVTSYLKREQYGERPLLSGPIYTAEMAMVGNGGDIASIEEGSTIYVKDEASGTYKDFGKKQEYVYAADSKMFFPRLGVLGDGGKTEAYRAWINPPYGIFDRESRSTVTKLGPGELQKADALVAQLNEQNESKFGTNRYRVKDIITWGDNISFFFQYQIGYMYMRYFMWNFSGRQNDLQGTYSNSEGGWIVGIDAVDDFIGTLWGNPEWRQSNLSPERLNNYGRNKFYAIPFILGLIGLVFLYTNDWKKAFAVSVLFFTTGMIFNIYGNQPPIEPRERDYVIVGSLFAYSFFIGLSVIAMYRALRDKINPNIAVAIAFGIALVGPVLMGFNGWDDHNRDGRTTAVDFASNYLNSCEPNAIIFTQGDNDTYPLWYAQENEGIRTDVRVINLSLLGVDWYINQLRYKMNDADPIKLTFTPEMLRAGNRDVVQFVQNPNLDQNKYYEAKQIMSYVANDKTIIINNKNQIYNFPSKKLSFPINRQAALAIGLIAAGDSTSLPAIELDLQKNSLYKYDLLTLDIVANNINERPIYFAVSVSPSSFIGFQNYFEQEGLTYRIVPRKNLTGQPTQSPVNTDVMYDNMMTDFKWGQIDTNPKVYVDENISRMTLNLVSNFVRLAGELIKKGELERGIQVLDKCIAVLPIKKVPYNFFHSEIPGLYIAGGQKEKAREVAEDILASAIQELDYFVLVYNDKIERVRKTNPAALAQYQAGLFSQNRSVMEQLYLLQQISNTYQRTDDKEFADKIAAVLADYSAKLKKI
jgi:hypothetical protein